MDVFSDSTVAFIEVEEDVGRGLSPLNSVGEPAYQKWKRQFPGMSHACEPPREQPATAAPWVGTFLVTPLAVPFGRFVSVSVSRPAGGQGRLPLQISPSKLISTDRLSPAKLLTQQRLE